VGVEVGVDRRSTGLGRLDPVVNTGSSTVRAKITDVVKVRVELRAHGLLEGVLGDTRLRQLLVHASDLSLSSLELLLETQHLSHVSLRDVVELRVSAGSGSVRVGKSTRARGVWRRLTTTLGLEGSVLLAELDLLLGQLGQEIVEVLVTDGEVWVTDREGLRDTKTEAGVRHRHGRHSNLTLLMEIGVSTMSMW